MSEATESTAGTARPPRPEHLLEAARSRVGHVLDLAAAEGRLATMSGLSMLLLVLFAGASLVIAWALLVASAIYLLAQTGLQWPIAAVCFAAAHAALAYVCWQLTTGLSRNLTLPKTRDAVVRSKDAADAEQGSVEHAGR